MSSYDLSGLYIKFQECPPDKKLVEWASELQPFPEFTECDEDRIKIAILSGDIDSPFARIKERDTMMRAIFEEIGLDLHKNKKLLEDCISYRDDKYMFAWVKYLQILHETDFTNWVLAKKDYEFYLEKTNEKQRVDEKGEIIETDLAYMKRRKEAREQIKILGEEVRSIEAKIFPDSKAAREAAISESKKKILLLAEKYGQPYHYF